MSSFFKAFCSFLTRPPAFFFGYFLYGLGDDEGALAHGIELTDVEDGDIILLHDGYESTVEAALYLIDELSAQGYEFVTVDELLFD